MKKKSINREDKNQEKKGKIASVFSGLLGGLSFLGGWQVCHNLCLGIIALLSIIGITVIGMPLLFLTQYTIYFWSFALVLLVPTAIMYWRHKNHMSPKIVFLNIGIIITSIPFFQEFVYIFWTIGGILIVYSIFLFIKERIVKNI